MQPSQESSQQPVANYLHRFAAKLGDHWQCDLAVRVIPDTLQLDDMLVSEICLILSEGAANAVRHGAADRMLCTVSAENGTLQLCMKDNGAGIPAIEGACHAPRSIQARARKLGGTIEVESSDQGLALSVSIPLHVRAA